MILSYDTELAADVGVACAIVHGYINERVREMGVPLKGVLFSRITKRGCAKDLGISVNTATKSLAALVKKGKVKTIKLPHDSGFWYTTDIEGLEEGGLWNGN